MKKAAARVDNLDYQRGLMAVIVIAYHYSLWVQDYDGTQNNLEVTAIYCVAGFYVLSGITMHFVYKDSLQLRSTMAFFVKRIFRIFPLFWLATGLTWFFISSSESFWRVCINFTGIFSVIEPSNTITNGGWSVGNELVFYLLFPLLIWLMRKSVYILYILFACFIGVTVYFSFFLLDPDQSLASQWTTFVNPLNHAVYFIGGVLLGNIIGSYRNSALAIVLFLAGASVFLFYPVTNEQITAVVKWDKIVFSLAIFAITISFFLFRGKVPAFFHRILSTLGHISYSIYLLQFVLFFIVAYQYGNMENLKVIAPIAFAITILVSFISYNFLEKPFINLGNRIIAKFLSN